MGVGLLNAGSSALLAAYTQLRTTGHNIANAATPGYSRQETITATSGADYSGGGYIGRGVEVVDIRRRYDRYVSDEVAASTATSEADRARAQQLSRLDKIVAEPEIGIGAAFDDLNLAMADVVNRPADPGTRGVVLARAETLAARVRGVDRQLDEVAASIEGRIATTVSAADDAMARLGRLNNQISQTVVGSVAPNDLLDQRDQLLVEINRSLKATAYIAQDGTASVFAAGGQPLVVGERVAKLTVRPDPADPSRSQVELATDGARLPMDAESLGGGALAGLMRARNEDLASMRNRIGQLAAAIAGAFNGQQAAGLDATGQRGAPLFTFEQPSAIPAKGVAGSADFTVSVADASRLKASDYQLDFDGSQYRVTRQSDGAQVASFAPPAAGTRIDLASEGLSITLHGGVAAAGDRFALQTASKFARGFERALHSASGLATALSMTPQAGAANAGSLAVNAFSADPVAATPLTLNFTGPNTFDVPGATPPLTGQSYTPGQPISLGGWSMTLTGTPKANDTIAVVPVTSFATDNRNARAMAELSDAASAVVDGASINDAYAAAIADIGTRTQSATAAQTMSQKLLDNANAARADVAGVNLDEEAARLLQYQQAYQAAAKVIQAAQSMFDTLINATR